MARMFIDSFEGEDFSLWDVIHSSSSIVLTTGLNMKGNYCASFNDDGYLQKNFSDRTEIYCAFQLRTKQILNCNNYLNIFYGSNYVFRLGYYNGYFKYMYDTNYGFYIIGNKYISNNTNYFIQIYFKYGTNGKIFVKVNGIIDVDKDDDTTAGYSYTIFDNVRFGDNSYIDNIVLDDSEMPEETEIMIVKPVGVGAYSDFISTPSGNNYSCVDEIPYNDVDYITSSGENAIDTYLLDDISQHAKSIKCVQFQTRIRKDSDSLLTNFNFVIRKNSTNYYSDDIALTNTFDTYSNIFYDGPTGSGFWYPSTVNSMEVGIRARA